MTDEVCLKKRKSGWSHPTVVEEKSQREGGVAQNASTVHRPGRIWVTVSLPQGCRTPALQ